MRIPALLLAAAALGACSSDAAPAPPETPPSPGAPNTGFIAFAVVAGQPKLYTIAPRNPDGWEPIAVLDPAAAGSATGLTRRIDLGADVSPAAVAADGSDVVVVDGSSPRVFFLDAASDAVKGSAPLPAPAEVFFVSGTNLFASGVAVDAARRRAWVSYSGGVAEYDLDARGLAASYGLPAAENFAHDRAGRLLYLPFYLCDPKGPTGGCDPYPQPGGPTLTDSVTVLDLASGRSFSLVSPAAADPHAPLGFEVDAVALDTDLGLLGVVAENPPALHVLEAAPAYDRATLTCRLPLRLTVPLPPQQFAALTADAGTHLAVVAQEGGPGIAFVDLAQARLGTVRMLTFALPDTPDGQPWVTRADPHGVTVGSLNGRRVAFVASMARDWIARVDLQAVSALATGDQAGFAAAVSEFLVPPTPTRPP